MQFDPWEHAAELAKRLNSSSDVRLIVALGAGWCHKCFYLRPVFDVFSEQASEKDLFLWLDIDEHISFIGDYIPDDLPELLIYRQGLLLERGILTSDTDCLAAILSRPTTLPADAVDPGVWRRLACEDWATTPGHPQVR
ncbi:thioredoxin family protein [Pseudomonas paralcaligenes]|uniref:thioredoxin family protein n=1 Tax=Pseudomonas paralcaligenes TaxID=2772558 RepID=UPI0021D04DE9|nr:thioredoxin family protein [Pseudomonas paralcaligenes]